VFIGLVLIPIFALSIELGRYFYAIAEVQKAADAAALAAAAEFDPQVFQESGDLVPNSRAWGTAQTYVSANTAGLSAKGVHAFVSDIQFDSGEDTVLVRVSADLSLLFPWLLKPGKQTFVLWLSNLSNVCITCHSFLPMELLLSNPN
jgi:Flp pilus assembly protein TadG